MAEENVSAFSNPALLEARITTALETAPLYTIPPGFAGRVAGRVDPTPVMPLSRHRYGYRTAIVCLVVLFGLVVANAPRAMGTSLYWHSIEAIFCAQFALLAVWLAARDYFSLSAID